MNKRHTMAGNIDPHLGFHLGLHQALPKKKILDAGFTLAHPVCPVQTALIMPGEINRSFFQGFGREGPGIDAGAAHLGCLFNQGNAFAMVGALDCRLLAGGTRPDHHQFKCG